MIECNLLSYILLKFSTHQSKIYIHLCLINCIARFAPLRIVILLKNMKQRIMESDCYIAVLVAIAHSLKPRELFSKELKSQ